MMTFSEFVMFSGVCNQLSMFFPHVHCAGLVQHKVVVWVYFALELSIPAVFYSSLSYDGSLASILVCNCPSWWQLFYCACDTCTYNVRLLLCQVMGLFVSAPPFLLTLLEAQGLFYWTGEFILILHTSRGYASVSLSIFFCTIYKDLDQWLCESYVWYLELLSW